MSQRIDRQAVQQEINALLNANNGQLTPDDVLKAGANVNSALYECFEWDNAIAGPAYRLEQARNLIKVFVIPWRSPGKGTIYVPRLVSIDDGHGQRHYEDITIVMLDVSKAAATARDAVDRAIAILSRHPHPVCQKLAGICGKERGKI